MNTPLAIMFCLLMPLSAAEPPIKEVQLKNGTTLYNVTVKAVTADGVKVEHRDGAGTLKPESLPPALLAKYEDFMKLERRRMQADADRAEVAAAMAASRKLTLRPGSPEDDCTAQMGAVKRRGRDGSCDYSRDGAEITAYFQAGKLTRMDATGNAPWLTYAKALGLDGFTATPVKQLTPVRVSFELKDGDQIAWRVTATTGDAPTNYSVVNIRKP